MKEGCPQSGQKQSPKSVDNFVGIICCMAQLGGDRGDFWEEEKMMEICFFSYRTSAYYEFMPFDASEK